MTGEERRKAISAGIRERLKREEGDPPRRGFRAELARAATLSTAHVSNFLNGKADVDQDAATRIAERWWKRTLRDVEDDVLGDLGSAPAQSPPPTRTVDRDDAPWRQLAEVNASFDAWAGGRYRRAEDKDATVAGLNYAARSLPRHSEEGGVQVVYRAKEMERLALIGEALDRGEDVEEDPMPPPPPPPPPAPTRPSLAERAAKIEADSKAKKKRR